MSTTGTAQHLKAWRNSIIATFIATGFAVSTVLSRLPGIRDQLSIEPGQVGLLIGTFSVGSLVGLLVASHVVHLLGPRRVIRIALVVIAAAMLVVAIGAGALGDYWVTIVGMVCFGPAMSICDVAMNVSGAANERAIGKTLLPLFHAGFSIGSVIGAAVGALAAAASVSITWHLLGAAVVLVVTACIAPSAVPQVDPDTDAPKPTRAQRVAIWRDPRTYLIGLLVLGFGYAEGAATDWLPIGLVDARGFDEAQGAAMLSLFMVAMTIGRIAGGPLVDRIGRLPALLGSAALAAIGLAVVIWVPEPVAIVIAVVVWGLGSSLGFPLGMSAAADDPALATARVSAVAIVGYTAFLVGPTVVGFVAQHTGVLPALNIVLGLVLMAGIVSPAAREPRPPTS